jgi:hypothetical protein
VKPSVVAGWLSVTLFAAAAVYAGGTPFGGWLQSWLYGSGIRWQDAYRALDAAEPGGVPDIERRRLAWAQAEDEPPKGMPTTRRLHAAGVLARLRYETFDVDHWPLDTWEVRALVPRLPDIVPPSDREHPVLGFMSCPPECQAGLARWNGRLLSRSGEPGLSSEWVLRMPVGEAFDLGSRSLVTHDVFADEARRLAVTSRRLGDRTVVEPANIRVTLVEVCRPRVRVGTLMRLQVAEHAILPIPRGFRTVRWVQLDGCPALMR